MLIFSKHYCSADVINNIGRTKFEGLLKKAVQFSFLLLMFNWSTVALAHEENIGEIIQANISSVVNISTIQKNSNKQLLKMFPNLPNKEFFEGFDELFRGKQNGKKISSLGSGFVYSSDGIILTNNHVIDKAEKIIVSFQDGSEHEAEVIGKDPKTDVAVLKIKSDKKLNPVELGDSNNLRLGDTVIAIGNPFGLGGTVTVGVISAINRGIDSNHLYNNFIQTDAAINTGNSGGPLFDSDGKVIGINTAIISPNGASVGIAFALPIDEVKKVALQLINYGETQRGWLGVYIQGVDKNLAKALGFDEPKGAIVSKLFKDGPAEEYGFEIGDIIIKFGDKEIKEISDLTVSVAESKPDERYKVLLIRDGNEKIIEVKLAQREKVKGIEVVNSEVETAEKNEYEFVEYQGLKIGLLNKDVKKLFNISDDIYGVVIRGLDPDSPYASAGLRVGQVISRVGFFKVKDLKDFEKFFEKESFDKELVSFGIIDKKTGLRFIVVPSFKG